MDGTSTFASLASIKEAQRKKGVFVPVIIKNDRDKNGHDSVENSEQYGLRVEILVVEGPAKGKRFVIEEPTDFLFGRQTNAHLSIPNDQFISRQHFALQISKEECRLRDLNSKNGVLVNGVRYGGRSPRPKEIQQAPINELRLQDGDRISVGTTHIQIAITPRVREIPNAPQEKKTSEDVALFVLDLVKSTQHLLKVGDQAFSALINEFRARFYQHNSSTELLSLKCTGDGFLAVYRSASPAFGLASHLLQSPVSSEVQVRMALHWGTVKSIPDGTFIGQDIQRMYHLEGLQASDLISSTDSTKLLPPANRMLITPQAMKRLKKTERCKCREAGKFHLRELDESFQLWVHAS